MSPDEAYHEKEADFSGGISSRRYLPLAARRGASRNVNGNAVTDNMLGENELAALEAVSLRKAGLDGPVLAAGDIGACAALSSIGAGHPPAASACRLVWRRRPTTEGVTPIVMRRRTWRSNGDDKRENRRLFGSSYCREMAQAIASEECVNHLEGRLLASWPVKSSSTRMPAREAVMMPPSRRDENAVNGELRCARGRKRR